MSYARIIGTGSYLPEKVLSNADLEKIVDTKDEWIVTRTGIKQRHIAGDDETTCDLATAAARQAIDAAGIDPNTIDIIVVATTTPDQVFPSTACLVQDRLNIHGCPAFDVQAVCSGFVYGLDIVNKYFSTGTVKRALVIGAETLSRIIDWKDRTTCVLFGDGAGAVILEASDEPGIISSHIHADGKYNKLLHVPGGISKNYKQVLEAEAYVQMQGSEVFKVAVKTLGDVVIETLAENNMDQSEIDWLVPHQANIRIILATAKKLGMPMDKVVVTVDQHGNTSAASIPLAFDYAVRENRIKPGEMILMEAFGGGFTWGSVLLKY